MEVGVRSEIENWVGDFEVEVGTGMEVEVGVGVGVEAGIGVLDFSQQ